MILHRISKRLPNPSKQKTAIDEQRTIKPTTSVHRLQKGRISTIVQSARPYENHCVRTVFIKMIMIENKLPQPWDLSRKMSVQNEA